jgi:hypothetical protein
VLLLSAQVPAPSVYTRIPNLPDGVKVVGGHAQSTLASLGKVFCRQVYNRAWFNSTRPYRLRMCNHETATDTLTTMKY